MSERQTQSAGRAKAHLSPEQALGSLPNGQGRPASGPHSPLDLTLCPCCDRDFVYPMDWEPAGRHGWNISLRCPECEWRGTGVFAQEIADRFDNALDESTASILQDIELMRRARREASIEKFVAALDSGLILPEDF